MDTFRFAWHSCRSKKFSQKIPQKFLGVQNPFFKKGFPPRSEKKGFTPRSEKRVLPRGAKKGDFLSKAPPCRFLFFYFFYAFYALS